MTARGITFAVLAAFCFGIMPILTKLIYGTTGVDPFFFLMLRYTMAAVVIWSYLLLRGNRNWRAVDSHSFGLIVATAFSYIVVTSTYFIALQYIDASLNSLLVFTFPVLTPFLGRLLFKEELHWFQILAALAGVFGCGLLIGNYHFKGTNFEMLGIGLGLVSGLLYALYTLFGQKITVRVDPLTVTAYNLTIVAVFFISLRLMWLWSHPQPLEVYLVAGILALVSTILANTFYFEAIKNLGAVKAGIFSSVEPFFTAVLAVAILNERFRVMQWLGSVFLIAAIVIVQRPWRLQPVDKS